MTLNTKIDYLFENNHQTPLLTSYNITKIFQTKGEIQTGIKDVSLEINEDEIIAILGQSGSGKSTLLRLLAGLIEGDYGEIYYKSKEVTSPLDQTKMVFQHYALLPWLSVFDNIAFGLKAKNIHPEKIKQLVGQTIELIGLRGLEKAYPSQLSGGMSQRVGFARALVTEPEILLLDEAFSALDVITANKLRSDVLNLWTKKQLNTKAIVMVTHDISEAIEMADRIIILTSNPGTIAHQISIDKTKSLTENEKNRYHKDILNILDKVIFKNNLEAVI